MAKRWCVVMAVAALGAGGPVRSQPPGDAGAAARCALTESNRAVITRFAALFYGKRAVREAMLAYVLPAYIQHNPDVADGRDAAIASVEKVFGQPGARFDVKRIVVDGDIAVIHLRGQVDPAHPALALFDMYRLENGKIAEHWDVGRPIPDKAANPHPMF